VTLKSAIFSHPQPSSCKAPLVRMRAVSDAQLKLGRGKAASCPASKHWIYEIEYTPSERDSRVQRDAIGRLARKVQLEYRCREWKSDSFGCCTEMLWMDERSSRCRCFSHFHLGARQGLAAIGRGHGFRTFARDY